MATKETQPTIEVTRTRIPIAAEAPPVEPTTSVRDEEDEPNGEEGTSDEGDAQVADTVVSDDEESDEEYDIEERGHHHRRSQAYAEARARFSRTIRDEVYAANPGARTLEIATVMAKRWREESAAFIERIEAEKKARPHHTEALPSELYGSDSDSDV